MLVADQSQGNDVDVPDLLFQGGLWDLMKGPGQVWDNDFVDDLGLWGAELAEDVGWEGSDPGLCNAGGLDQLRQAGDGQRVSGWDLGYHLNLGDELEENLDDLLGWGHDVTWQEHEEGADLTLRHLSLTDHLDKELDGLWGSSHDNGVNEQLLDGLSLLWVESSDQGGVKGLDLFNSLKGGHATDGSQEPSVDLRLSQGDGGGLSTDNSHDLLQQLDDLGNKFSLGWSGFRVKTLEEGPWDGLGQNLAVLNLSPWDQALCQWLSGQLLGGNIMSFKVTGTGGNGNPPFIGLTAFSLRVWRDPETTRSVLVPIKARSNSPSLTMVWMVKPVAGEPQAIRLVVEDLVSMDSMLLTDSDAPFCMK